MRRILALTLPIIAVLVLSVPALAAPNESASHVAGGATGMGGQHVTQCAQSMDQGVSACARAE